MTRPASTQAMALLPNAPPALREPSQALAQAMALALAARPAGDPGGLTQQMAQAAAPEARRRLDAIQAAMQQRAEPEVIREWMIRVISLIGHPTDADQIAFKVAALTDLLGGVPRRCLTVRSAGEVAMRFRFFPSASELMAIIQPEAAELEREQRRLTAVLRAASPPPPPPTLSPEERSAMSAAAAAYLAEAAEREARRRAAEMDDVRGEAAARRRANSPDTTDEEIRQMAATQGAGAALARMRLELAHKLRGGGEGR